MVPTISIGNIAFTPRSFGLDNPVGYQNGSILSKYQAVVPIAIQKYTKNVKRLSIQGNTITIANALDNETFDGTYGFVEGETFIIHSPEGAVKNNGTLTIASVDGQTITTPTSLVTEEIETCYVFMNTKVTALDYYYNLIANSDQLSFVSKTDTGNLQKYTVSGIDPTNTEASVYLQIGTKSFAWVTDTITAPTQSTSTIIGAGWTGWLGGTPEEIAGSYIQSFVITHTYFLAPFFLPAWYSNMQSLTPPSDFQDIMQNGQPLNNGWQYVCQINAKYAAGAAYQNTGQNNPQPGNSAWFDMNDARTTPEFTVASIAYANAATGAPMTALDFGKQVNVTIKIKSASGLFSVFEETGTHMVLQHIYCPMDPTSFQNNGFTLLQNFMHDGKDLYLNEGVVQTNNNGTNYQVMQNISAVYVDAYDATITFLVNYSPYLQGILAAKSPNDRNYAFAVTVETTQD